MRQIIIQMSKTDNVEIGNSINAKNFGTSGLCGLLKQWWNVESEEREWGGGSGVFSSSCQCFLEKLL